MKLSENTDIRYLTKQGDTIAGPYSREGHESLVYLGKITPDTLLGREGTDEFIPIRQSDLVRVLFPRLQEKVAPKAWGRPGQSDRHDVKEFKFGETKFTKVNTAPGAPGRIEVRQLLHEVRQAERDAGRDFVGLERFRISKRTRDFWVVLVAGNALFYGAAFFLQNTASWVFAIAGSGLFTWGLIWSMFGVMNRY
jgi:hypothetical protein